MGSFRPVAGSLHLHRQFNFTEFSSRQCPDRYAFRAGRNLPDKEFRYLRTVIVTAAVYWALQFRASPKLTLLLTFQHRAGVSPYTSSYDFAETCVLINSRLGLFTAAGLGPAPLPPKLRGHFAEFLNESSLAHLRIPPRLPVSVCGTGS